MATKQTGIRFNEDLLNKLKYAAWHERVTLTEYITGACEKAIATFEKKQGGITDKELKEARIIE